MQFLSTEQGLTPSNNAEGVTLSPNFQGENLSRIQPRNRQPRRAEDESENVDKARRRRAVRVRRGDVTGRARVEARSRHPSGQEHCHALTYSAPVQCPSPADSIEREDADERGEHVEDVIETADPSGGKLSG